jgi:GT2 family glycosyltransferase
LLFDDRGRINSLGSNIHITGLGFCRGLDSKDDSSISITRVPGVHGCSYLIRREILELLGGAPVHCFMGNDDVVISWAINLMDWEIYCVPEAVVYRKYKLEMNPDKFFILERNRHELLLTTLRVRTLAILLPALAVIEILVWAYCLIKGKSYLRAKLRAISAVRRDLYDIRRRRARLKQMRRISDLDLLKKFRFNLEWRQLLRILR